MDTDSASPLNFDDPAATPEQRLTTLRALLTQRINGAAQPSRLINQLHDTHERCLQRTRQLRQLSGRAPRILAVIHQALREAFALDPHTLLFSEPPPPRPASQVNSLIDRALDLFARPGVPINLHHFTALSVQGEALHRLPFNAWEVMDRVRKLRLSERVDSAVTGYWQQLAEGSWLSRAKRWAELHSLAFADQAYLAHQVFELSAAAYSMVKQLVDAPTAEARQRAGGAWAALCVETLTWPRTDSGVLAIPGALYLRRAGEPDAPVVVYLPGLQQAFREFSSWHQLQNDLPVLIQQSLLNTTWLYLPFKRHSVAAIPPGVSLNEDALAHSAQALLDGQLNDEWGSLLSLDYTAPAVGEPLPSRRAARLLRFIEKHRARLNRGPIFASILDELLEWDRQRRHSEILLASLSADLPRMACEGKLQRYESRLSALHETDAAAYQALLQLEGQRQELLQKVSGWTLGEAPRLFQPAFWLERLEGSRQRAAWVVQTQRRALRQEAQLELALQMLQQPHLDGLLEVLDTPLAAARGNSDTRVLRITLGAGGLGELMGVFVVTTARALSEPMEPQPVLLVVSGGFGGLAVFDTLHSLTYALRASLTSRDGSVLWRCIGRDVRKALQSELSAATPIDYRVEEGDALHGSVKALIEYHARLHKRLNGPARLFSEVADVNLARQLLADELRDHLQVPAHDARAVALANVEYVRFGAVHSHARPPWLTRAPAAHRQRYRRLQRSYLANALALESRLWQVLPSLETFARGLLAARLKADGFSSTLDMDQPLLDMPDDVSRQFCGWSSQCVVGDRHAKTVVSRERTTFSLLDLALHNLDPQAPWTEWRLNRARWHQPEWKARLSPRYLIDTLSELDIGGQYTAWVQRVFHPTSQTLPRPLIDRSTLQLARLQAFSAVRQGLSIQGQSLFSTAMAARGPADLCKNGHELRLGFVRLCGLTLAQHRHIAGILIIIDQSSQRCVVYWPGAQGSPTISEHDGVEQARIAINASWATPDNSKALARQVAPGWETEALAGYPGQPAVVPTPVALLNRVRVAPILGFAVLRAYEAIRRFVASFKIKHTQPSAVLPVIEAQIKEQILADPKAWLDIVLTAQCDAQALFAHARMLEIQQRAQASANSIATLDQYREQRLAEQNDARVRGLLSFIPVIGVGISVYELLLAARRYHLSQRAEDAVDVVFLTLMAFVDVVTSFIPGGKTVRPVALHRSLIQLHQRGARLARLPSAPQAASVLERFRKSFSIDTAVPLQGPGERGVYVKNGEQFWRDGEHFYPVYRRTDEHALRIKNPGGEAEGELLLFIREDREWSLGADAPPVSPQPGPSSAIWRPFNAPAETSWRPPSHTAVELRLRQTQVPPQHFQAWASTASLTLTALLPERSLFEVTVRPPARPYRVVQFNGRHYRVLPDGAQVSSRTLIFITRDQPLEHAASLDIAYWLEVGAFDQPIPATLGSEGAWVFHRPLFSESLRVSLARAFPFMTTNSRTFLIERLLALSDRSPSLTASHLLSLRATLDRWLAPGALGQTDDLLKLLRPLESAGSTRIYIGSEPITPGFQRMDFTVVPRPGNALFEPTQHNQLERARVMQNAVRAVLEAQGFVVRSVEKKAGAGAVVDFCCTHPQTDNLYYVLTRWSHTPSIKLNAAHAMQMTDAWFIEKSTSFKLSAVYAPIKQALDEHRLVKIIAGIQWTAQAPPTVYFVRFGSLRPGAAQPRRPRRKRPRLPG
ncbi:dermonecrotic toxin domain-containing protein [Pseudomonas sp. SDO5271_S396]